MKPVPATPLGVKTAWADPEHMRLTQLDPDDRVKEHRTSRLRGPDPDDPWATPDEDGGEAA